MKKCFILLAVLFIVLAVSKFTEETNNELSENTLALSKIENENTELEHIFDK